MVAAMLDWLFCGEIALDLFDEFEVELQVAPQELVREEEVFAPVREQLCCCRAFFESIHQLGDIRTKGYEACAGDRFSDEVAEEEPEERVALERRDAHRRSRVVGERRESPVSECVDSAFAGLARFATCLEVAEPCEPLWLDVVLALSGPVEDSAALGHPKKVVRAGAAATDEPEDLVREEAELRA